MTGVVPIVDSFKDAWKNRHTLGDKEKERTLCAFLPAALEIQETPPPIHSPAG
jgi:hemolysin D